MSNVQVFISYSHNDIAITEALARYLESVGLKCWYAPRDIAPGADWASSIVSAIQEAPYFVLIFSDSSNESDQVYNEVDMACKTSDVKHTVINFRVSNAEVSGRLSYYVNSKQWVDATEDPDRAYITLARQLREGLGMGGVDPAVTRRTETAADRRARKEQEKELAAAQKEEEQAQREKEKAEEAARKEEERAQKEREKQRQAEEKEQARQARREKWQKVPIRQILIALLIVIVLIAVMAAVLTHKETVQVHLNDYVSVEYEGYDSYGTASVVIDYDGLEEALSSAEWKREGLEALYADEEDDEDTDTVSVIMESYTVYDMLASYLGETPCSLSAVEGLSNGDTVSLLWTVDEDLPSLMNQIAYCSISFEDEEMIVDDLIEIEAYDPFDALSVVFQGMSGDGTAGLSVTASDDIAEAITYSLSETKGLSNGETITVTVTNDPDEFETVYGVRLAATERDYTVTGLSSYVADPADIPEDAFSEMRSEVEDHFNAYVASNWNLDCFTVLGFDCIGYYFLAEKSDSSPHNMVFVVYQVNVEYYVNDDSGAVDELLTYYYYGGFENLILQSDGSVSLDYLEMSAPSEKFSAYDATFYGYQTLSALYSEVVTTRIGDYTDSDQVEDQDFGYGVTHADEIEEEVVNVSYVTDPADIPEEILTGMCSEVEDHFNAYAASNWNLNQFTVLGLDYIGYYFLAEKSDSSPHNMVFVVYQVNVEYYVEEEAGTTDELLTYYYYGGFEDLTLMSDGSISVDYMTMSTPSEEFPVYDATFYGYQTLDTLFRDVVTTRIGDYISYNQVEDQDFGYAVSKTENSLSEEETKEAENAQSESGISAAETEGTSGSGDGAYLGVVGTSVSGLMAETYDMPEGIYITVIIEGGAASDSDLKKRDIITAVDGQSVLTMADLRTALESYAIGDEVVLSVQRLNESAEYEEMAISVVLGDYSAIESYEQSITDE